MSFLSFIVVCVLIAIGLPLIMMIGNLIITVAIMAIAVIWTGIAAVWSAVFGGRS